MTPRPAAVLAGLWLAAAVISGFTLNRYLDPLDEGVMLQAASRIAGGQWPYRDFAWPYGPGQPLVLGAWFALFEPTVVVWRVLRAAADATVALLVLALVRPAVGWRWGLAAWLTVAVTMAQPTTANPFPWALAFGLGAILAGARGRPGLGGLLVAGAAFWRPDFGFFAGAALLAALALAPPDRRGRELAVGAGVAVGASAVLYLPFAVATGLPGLYEALVGGSANDGGFWRLPFPLLYDGPLRLWPPDALLSDGKDALGYSVPLLAVAGLVAIAVALVLRLRARRATPELAGLVVLGLGSLLYLVSRADELHQQPLAVAVAAGLALTGAAAAAGPGRRWVVWPLAGLLAVLAVAGVANRVSALVLPPSLEPVAIAGAGGIRVPASEARALPALVAEVQAIVPPGEPIYVAPRRSDLVSLSNPLLHVLLRRPNILRRDVLLQAKPEEQARIVAALRRARPRAVVRWTDPVSARPEPNERGRSSGVRTLDAHLAAAYRLHRRLGAYDLLVPR